MGIHRTIAARLWALLAAILCLQANLAGAQATPPTVGERAKNFALESLEGQKIHLAELTKTGPLVLIVLRGWPGYHCPICSTQVGGFVGRAKDIKMREARVVLVYPGPAERLGEHAREFFSNKSLPANWRVLMDPDFSFTNAYNLRWNTPKETAYPSTFVIARGGKILLAKISRTHGDRATPDEVLAVLPGPTKPK